MKKKKGRQKRREEDFIEVRAIEAWIVVNTWD